LLVLCGTLLNRRAIVHISPSLEDGRYAVFPVVHLLRSDGVHALPLRWNSSRSRLLVRLLKSFSAK
jgi:hypothetical protein